MRKKFFIALAASLLFSSVILKAQDKMKEGKATFDISYPDAEEMNDQMLAMMPKESVTYFKDGKTRTEIKAGYGTTIVLSDPDKKESYVCMDIMGKKSAIKSTEEDTEKQRAEMGEYDVKLSDETKKIAGYVCKKATIAMKKDGNNFDVWYTDALPYNSNSRYAWKGVEGFPMEFTIEQKSMGGNIKMKMECISVSKATVKDEMFNLPEGYTVMTQEEMKKQWGNAH
jgi:hypothetical protein